MSEALDLIAEARRLQEKAERDRDYWKEVAQSRQQRCRLLIDMIRRRPIEPPTLHDGKHADEAQLSRMVDEFAHVIADPYARYPDDDDPGPTHENVKIMMVYRLQCMISDAIDRRAA